MNRSSPNLVTNNIGDKGLMNSVYLRDLSLTHHQRKLANLISLILRQLTSIATPNIYGMRDKLKVIRIDTSPVSTKVIRNKSYWNSAVSLFIENTMCSLQCCIDRNVSISMGDFALPHPAGRYIAPILNQVKRAWLALAPALMAKDVTERLTTNVTIFCKRLLSKGGSFATSALTKTGGVRTNWSILSMHCWSLLTGSGVPSRGWLQPRSGVSRLSIIPDSRTVMGF